MSTNDQAEQLLKEAIKIIHTNLRNTHKDWLTRARNHVRNVETEKACSKGDQWESACRE